MSVQAKQTLVRGVTKDLENALTPVQLRAVADSLISRLSSLEVEYTETSCVDADTGELLDAFISAKEVEGRSEKTLIHYRYVIEKAIDSMGVSVRDLTVFHIRKYLSDEKKRGLADKTIEGIRSVFSSYFNWLQKERLLEDNPCANLGPVKCVKKVLLPYSDVELERLRECCLCDRDKAIISFLLSTGCRISEMTALDRDSVDLRNMDCVVYGKGAKERTVFLDAVAAMLLGRYLASRTDSHKALFVGKGSERLTPGGVRFMLKRLSERAGVENVHPHRFRRTLATNLINHGMAIQEVASILGHDNINTTMTYVYVDKANVKNNYRRLA